MNNNEIAPAARQLTADQEAELMGVFLAWFGLFTSNDAALSDQAAALFSEQVARGGAWRTTWIRVQDTLSDWWELPEGMREFLRETPLHEGFDRRALRTVLALADDEN